MDVKYGQIGKKVLASIIQTPDDVYTIIGDSLDNKANIDEFYSIEGSFKQVQK